jgi:hypothetical protein
MRERLIEEGNHEMLNMESERANKKKGQFSEVI